MRRPFWGVPQDNGQSTWRPREATGKPPLWGSDPPQKKHTHLETICLGIPKTGKETNNGKNESLKQGKLRGEKKTTKNVWSSLSLRSAAKASAGTFDVARSLRSARCSSWARPAVSGTGKGQSRPWHLMGEAFFTCTNEQINEQTNEQSNKQIKKEN